MRRALDLTVGTRPHPNPAVGALVLSPGGEVLAEAAHLGPGHTHAEALAVGLAGEGARHGTVVVTLEPCVHQGRTPPCTRVLIEAGVARVVVGAVDPDARVSGRGIAALRDAGIEVEAGVLADHIEAGDPGYFHHRRTGRPRVTWKAALTLDGQAAADDGTSQWITSPQAREDAHRLRAAADAVLVGAGTVLADDPRLSVRLPGYDGLQPPAVVVAGRRPLPPDAAIFARKTIVYSPLPIEVPAEVVVLPGNGGVDLAGMLSDLAERGHLDLLLEGGPTLAAALLKRRLVDRGVFYYGPLVAGGQGRGALTGAFVTLGDARPVSFADFRAVGPDLRVEFTLGERS